MDNETKIVQVTDVPIDVLERAREAAVANGAGRSDAAVLRWALHQYVLNLPKAETLEDAT